MDHAALERGHAGRPRVVRVHGDEVRGRARLEAVDAVRGLDRHVLRFGDRRAQVLLDRDVGDDELSALDRPGAGRRRDPVRAERVVEAVEEEDAIARRVGIGVARGVDRVAVAVGRGGRLGDRAGVAVVADAVAVLVVRAARRVLAEVFAVRDAVAVEVARGRDAGRAGGVGEVADRARAAGRGGEAAGAAARRHRAIAREEQREEGVAHGESISDFRGGLHPTSRIRGRGG